MEVKIEATEKHPILTYTLWVWKFITTKLFGLFTLPMEMWGYVDVTHRIVGKKSYFSSAGVAIVAATDQLHPGRFRIYAVMNDSQGKKIEFITYIYNGRKCSYKIDRHPRAWGVMVDGHNILMEARRTPIFTHNLLPKISDKMETKEVTIEL